MRSLIFGGAGMLGRALRMGRRRYVDWNSGWGYGVGKLAEHGRLQERDLELADPAGRTDFAGIVIDRETRGGF